MNLQVDDKFASLLIVISKNTICSKNKPSNEKQLIKVSCTILYQTRHSKSRWVFNYVIYKITFLKVLPMLHGGVVKKSGAPTNSCTAAAIEASQLSLLKYGR